MEPIAWDGPLPRHLAIIMDGNGRWARARGLPRTDGHREGARAVRRVVRTCRRLGIDALTLYAFSAQNWARPDDEVRTLMQLLYDYVHDERAEILDNRIRFNCFGELDKLPPFVRKPLDQLVAMSQHHDGMTLSLALSYGGREEIVQAARTLAHEVVVGARSLDQIDAQTLGEALWTKQLPAGPDTDVDLVIRTSGEQRVSNFLLWQIAYAELWFTDVLWPDFDEAMLFEALRDFGGRQRRFGALSDEEPVP